MYNLENGVYRGTEVLLVKNVIKFVFVLPDISPNKWKM